MADGLGVIHPPPDIRTLIDKTAEYVAKQGPAFEQRVLKDQSQKFSFLLPDNPFRAYYELRVKEHKAGQKEENLPAVPAALAEVKRKEEEKIKKKAAIRALGDAEKVKELKEPPPDGYTVPKPFITALDADLIMLTAQFVARNGQKFLVGLTQREVRNPQFDFLKPTHALFGYFTSLVDAYTKCLMPSKDDMDNLKARAKDSRSILDSAMDRYEWEREEARKAENKEAQEKKEREQMQAIDWHDFIPVESIKFTAEDDSLPLAAPLDTSAGVFRPIEVQPLDPTAKPAIIQEDEAMEIEVEEAEEEEEPKKEDEEVDGEPAAPEPQDAEEKPADEVEQAAEEEEEEEAEEEVVDEPDEIPILDDDAAPIIVKKDYQRQRKTSSVPAGMQRCPITGQLVNSEDMSQHLRVLLLDPKWKQQKDILLERAKKESAFADDVEANLAAFVSKRPDIFGTVEDQIAIESELGAEAAAREAGADAGPAHSVYNPEAEARKIRSLDTDLPPAPGSAALPPKPATMPPVPSLTGGMGFGMGMPSMASAPAPTPAVHDDDDDDDDENPAKRMKMAQLTPESEFARNFKAPISFSVLINAGGPAGQSNITLTLPVMTSVRQVKEQVATLSNGLEANKIRLLSQAVGLMKDSNTLAFYNVKPSSVLEVTLKERGGRKK